MSDLALSVITLALAVGGGGIAGLIIYGLNKYDDNHK